MTKTFRFVALAVALGVLACSIGACSTEEAGSDAGGGDASDTGGAGDADAFVEPFTEVLDPCVDSDQCGPNRVCDKRKGGCVECYTTGHCPNGEFCHKGKCKTENACETDDDCLLSVCGDQGTCVECRDGSTCPAGWDCVAQTCRPPFGGCTKHEDCNAAGAICDLTAGSCVSCSDDSQCGDYEDCDVEGTQECLPNLCPPSSAFCVGDVVQVCREDGRGYFQIECGEDQTCADGSCVFAQCTPGTKVCEKYQLKECTSQGTLVTKACPPGQECGEGGCVPLRHRVHVVFDTSGSMSWFPGTDIWPDMCGVSKDPDACLGGYPECESAAKPITKLAYAKLAFTKFFQEDNEDVVFGLQRFPQRTADKTPSCLGGWNTPDVVVTGDDHSKALSLADPSFLDQHLGEVVLEPFPTKGGLENVFQVLQWMNFQETTENTTNVCSKPEDCPDGYCQGLAGQLKTCRRFTDPELWAEGWTPLGKSLFYAAEYLRKYVVVDGKPCAKDAECGSPGYFCNAAGKCFDPLRECRLNAIILFTDGGETEHPFPTDYFNPQVQAKRMRYGLGCETDEDCSRLDYCINDADLVPPGEILEEYMGCHQAFCHPKGYCTNSIIEKDSKAQVKLSTQGTADRLTDYSGNPFSVIVNVVDASGDAPGATTDLINQNRLIALYGGGTYVAVDIDDVEGFVTKIKDTLDIKQRFTECAKALGQVINP